jgi:predicted dinucleotide-binding enzyme
MTSKKIAIIGTGNVGGALERGLKRSGSDVRVADNDAADIRTVAGWADVVILAVPFGAIDEVVASLGTAIEGKTVVDARTLWMRKCSSCSASPPVAPKSSRRRSQRRES